MSDSAPVVAVAALLLVAAGAVPVVAMVAQGTGTPADGTATNGTSHTSAANGTGETAANGTGAEPGARLAGVVGVQKAEIESEVETRAFGQAVAAAARNESKAGVVGEELDRLEQRLAELETEKERLRTARENGTISQGQFRSQMAQLHAEQRALERRANATERTASGLPAEALESKGIDADRIRTLKSEARNLTGPETAAIARGIAGRNVGGGIGGPDRAGPPAFVTNRSGGPGQGQAGPPNDSGPPDDAGQQRGGNTTDSGMPGQSAGNGGPDAANRSSGPGAGQADRGGDADRADPGDGSHGSAPTDSEP